MYFKYVIFKYKINMKLLQKQKGNSWFLHVQKGRIFYKKQKLLIIVSINNNLV